MALYKKLHSNWVLRSQLGALRCQNVRQGHSAIIPKPNRYFKSWKEVPDEFVKTYSERDPLNPVYQTHEWVKFKKMQIFAMQDPNVNPAFMNGPRDHILPIVLMVAMGLLGMRTMYNVFEEDFRIYRSKRKDMKENPVDWKTPKDKIGTPIITPDLVGA